MNEDYQEIISISLSINLSKTLLININKIEFKPIGNITIDFVLK